MSSVGPGGEETVLIHSLTNLSDTCGETIQSKTQHKLLLFKLKEHETFLPLKLHAR